MAEIGAFTFFEKAQRQRMDIVIAFGKKEAKRIDPIMRRILENFSSFHNMKQGFDVDLEYDHSRSKFAHWSIGSWETTNVPGNFAVKVTLEHQDEKVVLFFSSVNNQNKEEAISQLQNSIEHEINVLRVADYKFILG